MKTWHFVTHFRYIFTIFFILEYKYNVFIISLLVCMYCIVFHCDSHVCSPCIAFSTVWNFICRLWVYIYIYITRRAPTLSTCSSCTALRAVWTPQGHPTPNQPPWPTQPQTKQKTLKTQHHHPSNHQSPTDDSHIRLPTNPPKLWHKNATNIKCN